MRLHGMVDTLKAQERDPAARELSFPERQGLPPGRGLRPCPARTPFPTFLTNCLLLSSEMVFPFAVQPKKTLQTVLLTCPALSRCGWL